MHFSALLLLAACPSPTSNDVEQPALDSNVDDTAVDSGIEPVDADGDGVTAGEDCDDTDPAVFPGAEEACNTSDDDCDGELDEGLLTEVWRQVSEYPYGRTYIAYDAEGQIVRYGTDAAGDGALDTLWYWEWDGDKQVYAASDTGVDGVLDSISTWSYDAWGDLEEATIDRDADGVPEQVQRWSRTRDDAGNVVHEEYDAQDDGTPEWATTYDLDAAGRRIASRFDSDADGLDDEIAYFEWDDADQLLVESTDYYADGSVDRSTTWTYDANGKTTSQTDWFVGTLNLPDDFGGGYEVWPEEETTTGLRWTWDTDGYLLSLEFFEGEARTVRQRYSYTWSSDHLEVSMGFDYEADGTPETCERTMWDAEGHQTWSGEDKTCSGTYSPIRTSTWADGLLVRSEESASSYPWVVTYAYDALGREVLYEKDGHSDGSVDNVVTHTWSCWE